MAVDDGGMVPEWAGCFPFTAAFEQLVDGSVTVDLVEALVCVLEPAVQLYSDSVDNGVIDESTVRMLFYTANALARCNVALAYKAELCGQHTEGFPLLEMLRHEWLAVMKRECFVEVEYAAVVGGVLGQAVEQIWSVVAVRELSTLRAVWAKYAPVMNGLRFRPVLQVLVACESGVTVAEALVEYGDWPVVPLDVYRVLISRVRMVDLLPGCVASPESLLVGCDSEVTCGAVMLDCSSVRSWLWLMISSYRPMRGYCYQLYYPPALRYGACVVMREKPLVGDLLEHLDSVDVHWAQVEAHVDYGDVLHVVSQGCPSIDLLQAHRGKRIGMRAVVGDTRDVDYYARALVDEFITKHTPVSAVTVVPPLDAALETLSIKTDSTVGREFMDVAKILYSSVDENVSPRAELGRVDGTGGAHPDDSLTERESSIVQEVYSRLADGAVIHEEYFDRTYRRFRRFGRRPRLTRSDGRMYHVFEGFPADGGAGVGPWELDRDWGIPGWQSYVAVFAAGDVRTVSFTATGGCQDVRMDCSGVGAIELGDCNVRVDGTLLWFTNSVRLRVTAKEQVRLRVSVPDAGSAIAMGLAMRRYMHIPGYSVVARSYDIVTASVQVAIPMVRGAGVVAAGCHLYTGQQHVERGRHRFKLSQVASLAPAKLLFKAEPPDALQYVSVCGMRLHPHRRDYVAALVDIGNVDMYVSLVRGASFVVSMAQIVREREFDLAVASSNEARAAVRQ